MLKNDLITYINRETGIKRDTITMVLRYVTKYFCIAMARKEAFYLGGIGKFKLFVRKPKPVMDWVNKKRVIMPEKHQVKFQPSYIVNRILKEHDLHLQENLDAEEESD